MPSERKTRQALSSLLNQWSVGHSILTVFAILAALLTGTLWPPLVSGSLSFASIIFIGFKHLERKKLFNAANMTTAVRLGTVLLLPVLACKISNSSILAIGSILMLLDCLDGWLSRRANTTSVWGEFFDKETDAFFLLMICLVAFQKAVITGEIMAIGLLRYVFIISLFVLKRGPKKEERSFRAQSIFTIMMLVLLSLFLPLDFPRFPFVALGFVLVFFSFGEDFRKIASGS